jgi:hypothetical protein
MIMRRMLLTTCLMLPMIATAAAAQTQPAQGPAAPAMVEKPAALTADGIPGVPAAIAEGSRPYMEFRTAGFTSWHPRDRSMTISTRFGNTSQVTRGAADGRAPAAELRGRAGERRLVAQWRCHAGQKDVGGSEFYQIYTSPMAG